MRFVLVVSALAAAIVPGWRIDCFVSPSGNSVRAEGWLPGSRNWARARECCARDERAGLLFDLDGTLVESVYRHVLAWREALEEAGIELAVWRIHHHIGMSGDCSRTPCCGRSDIR